MKRTLLSGWEVNDWSGDFTADVLDPSGQREVDLYETLVDEGVELNLCVRDHSCCRSDMGGDVSCTVSVPLDAVVAHLELRGYTVSKKKEKEP